MSITAMMHERRRRRWTELTRSRREVGQRMSRPRMWRLVCLLASLVLVSGCERLRSDYGATDGVGGQQSLAGFGVMRTYFREQGWQDRTAGRLSERLFDYSALVWIPQVERPPSRQVSDWFEEWLSRKGRTLVYVLRDHQVVNAYWEQAAGKAEPAQRLEYRRRQAETRMDEIRHLLARPKRITNGWFVADALKPPVPYGAVTGAWANEIPALPSGFAQEYHLRAHGAKDPTLEPPPTPWNVLSGPGTMVDGEDDVELTEVSFRSVLDNSDGSSLVGEVTSPAWGDSKILIVSGGSLLTNYGLIHPGCRELLARVEQACVTLNPEDGDLKVGFLTTGESGPQMSMVDMTEGSPNGLEMLTQWPVNLVTIHALVCGLILALALFPILGRPRELPVASTSDFAAHIDAVANLMARTSGEEYARVRISEYMVRIRGEEDGPWVRPPTVPNAAPGGAAVPFADTGDAKRGPLDPDPHEVPAATGDSSPAGADRSVVDSEQILQEAGPEARDSERPVKDFEPSLEDSRSGALGPDVLGPADLGLGPQRPASGSDDVAAERPKDNRSDDSDSHSI